MKFTIIYLMIGTVWTFIAENISVEYNNDYNEFKEIHLEDPEEEFIPIDWTWLLRIAFILTWPIGIYQFILQLFNKK